jgi:hypothetical protein
VFCSVLLETCGEIRIREENDAWIIHAAGGFIAAPFPCTTHLPDSEEYAAQMVSASRRFSEELLHSDVPEPLRALLQYIAETCDCLPPYPMNLK